MVSDNEAIQALRAGTRDLHARLDDVAYAHRLGDGTLSQDDYACFLQTMRVLQAGLAGLGEPARARVLEVGGAREHELSRIDLDLEELGAAHALPTRLARAGEALAHAIAESAAHPERALGVLYVVEGSHMGALQQRKVLQGHATLSTHGHRYLSGDGSATRPRFMALISRLNAALTTPEQVADAVRGAQMTFDRTYDVMSQI